MFNEPLYSINKGLCLPLIVHYGFTVFGVILFVLEGVYYLCPYYFLECIHFPLRRWDSLLYQGLHPFFSEEPSHHHVQPDHLLGLYWRL